MKILFTGDWHLDLANLAYTVPAIETGIATARYAGEGYDLFVHAGDLVVNRSTVHPHVAHEVRRLIEKGSACRRGGIVIAGNHDQSFQADRVGMVEGIVGGTSFENIEIASMLKTIFREVDGCEVAFVCVPTPNKYHARALALQGADLVETMTIAVQGAIADAKSQGAKNIVGVYHGEITGAMISDERQMPSGVDLALPQSAFAGCDIVLAGHIHRRQHLRETANGPEVVYCGAVAPLTWNDEKMQPAMYLIEISDLHVGVSSIPLPIVSQMIGLEVNIDATTPSAFDAVVEAVDLAHPHAGDRVRVRVRGPGAALDAMSNSIDAHLEQRYSLASCKVVPERTDSCVARADVGITDSILGAVDKWAEMRGLVADAPETVRLLEFAREIETRAIDKHLDAHYEMRPRVLKLENWCQYGSAEIAFDTLGGLTIVEGPNYSGKSNLSRAILFALYKRQVAGNRLSDLIRNGEDKATVEFDFTAHGRDYRIVREIRRMKGGALASLHFVDLNDGVPLALAEGNARETQEAIEKIVGPLDLFLATCFAGQNQVDALLDLTPSEMKDLLMQLLQRDFASRVAMAREIDKATASAIDQQKNKIDALEPLIVPVDETALRTLTEKALEKQSEIDAASLKHDRLTSLVATIQNEVDNYDAACARKLAAQRRLEEARRRAAAAAERAAEAKDAAEQADRCVVPNAPNVTSCDCELRLAELNDKRALLDEGRAHGLKSVREVADEAREQSQQVATDIANNEHAIAAAERDIDRARADADKFATVPCCGGIVGDADGEPIDCGECEFLTGAVLAARSLPALKERLASLQELRERLRITAEIRLEDVRQTSQAVARFENEMATAIAEVNDEIKHAQAFANSTRQWETEIARAAAARDSLMHRASLLHRWLTEHDEAQQAVVEAEREASQETVDLDGAATLHLQLTETKKQADDLRQTMVGLATERDRLVSSHAAVQAQIDRNAEIAAKLATHRSAIRLHEQDRVVSSMYLEAMGRDGIPFLMLETFSIPMLHQVANDYLSGTGFSISIEAERELQSGEMRNAVEITFADHRGRHPIAAASGAQRTAIGSALRHGMAEILAQATGSKIWLAVQDEGFGTLDPENLEIAKRTLANIAERRGTFIVISHVPGMSEVADHVLRVVDAGGVSRVEVMS